MELIDRTTLLAKSYYRGKPATVNRPWGDGAEVVDVEDIEAMPTIDAVPVVHGRWVVKGQDLFCSHCDQESGHNPWGASAFSNYCPTCGAKMDLEE